MSKKEDSENRPLVVCGASLIQPSSHATVESCAAQLATPGRLSRSQTSRCPNPSTPLEVELPR